MLPPIIEVFIVWHPQDTSGLQTADAIFKHFMHGPTFSGVIGGGIQVSFRSTPWEGSGTAPRPIYNSAHPAPNGIRPARFTVIVPLLGTELAASVEDETSSWCRYIAALQEDQARAPGEIGIYPFLLSGGATNGTKLGDILGGYQFVAAGRPEQLGESQLSMLCRDLTQGIAQLVSPDEMDRLTTFISHTKRHSSSEGEDVDALVDLVREVIGNTRLREYFDASDLQPGSDWDAELRGNASQSAMLAIRTDLYASRSWCQREIALAKTNGMPVIMMDAIGFGEERGSFLMDHVPRVAVRKVDGRWQKRDVYRALNLLVDECLKRALWLHQKDLSGERPELDIAWWAPHAPEPLTLLHWIGSQLASGVLREAEGALRILHPDPPLGEAEREVLQEYAKSTQLGRDIDIMTPRQLATRGG
ncbi:TIR domain-containing protein [Rhodovulum sp. MB263]|uniref:TIR domain-containing protein n=1 Tax=Rhodovulum sp. (strain MB263) TaxID=308754 RepID=UPI0012DB00B0|nr:TIR domain-containing protein [Rhodovulum sp. MB263]